MTLTIQAAEPLAVKLSSIVIDSSILLRPVDEETAQGYAEEIKRLRKSFNRLHPRQGA